MECGLSIKETSNNEISKRMRDYLQCGNPIILVDRKLIIQRLECQKVLNIKCLFTTDFVPDNMRLKLSSQQFSSNKKLKVKSINSLLIKSSFEELFQKFIALMLIHFGWNIDLCGINSVFCKFC